MSARPPRIEDFFTGLCCGAIVGMLFMLALPEIASALAMWVGP